MKQGIRVPPGAQISPLHNRSDGFWGFTLGNGYLREEVGGNKTKGLLRVEVWGSRSATEPDCLHMMSTDTGLKVSNPACEGKGNTDASTGGGNCHVLCNLCPSWYECLWPCKRKKPTGRTARVLLSICAREQSLPAYCTVYGTLHFSEVQFPQKTLRVWLLVCSASFTSLHWINCYCAFKVRCLCSLLTVCILPTWHSKSGPPVSLSFHLLFPFHNVKLLRLQILTGNVSLQTERVSITCLMFH